MSEEEPKTLADLTAQGRRLLQMADNPVRSHSEFAYWDQEVARWLDSKFPDSGLSARWSSLPFSQLVSGGGYYDYPEHWNNFRQAVQKRLEWLSDINSISTMPYPDSGTNTRKIFVVHGHNEGVREKVARFLEKLQLEPIILHEQPNKGRTIIEKFTDHADVAYAVVLLTGDDRCGVKDATLDSQLLRPRQNVVFELGYFLGKLGRERVCALYESGIEILSDYSGVLYLPLDNSDSWKLGLAKELKAVGLSIDLNEAM